MATTNFGGIESLGPPVGATCCPHETNNTAAINIQYILFITMQS
jgi:hypothetical protein